MSKLEKIVQLAERLPREKRELLAELLRPAPEPIAVIGLGCRLPGGVDSPEAFWRLLHQGHDTVGPVPYDRWHVDQPADDARHPPMRFGSFVDGAERFDARFFGISPREADLMDPQHRMLLEVAWQALEHSGRSPDALEGSAAGVFVGLSSFDYGILKVRALDPTTAGQDGAVAGAQAVADSASIAAGRLAYVLGFEGPTMAVDTACSSSLTALVQASEALRRGDCDLALAGGVHLMFSAWSADALGRTGALSPGGRCRAFDARADGFGRGEGCGMVVLTRLSTALAQRDRVLAVLPGWALNHDGRSNGLTAPNPRAQSQVIRRALAAAGLEPAQVQTLEAHGTGTALGDPIEAQALRRVFEAGRETPLVLGSVKTNLGHLEAAAGVVGLIKLVLALEHRTIPPHLHFETLNPHIRWGSLDVELPDRPRPWAVSDGPRVAGVSSFGLSGTNAHVLVAEAPEAARPASSPPTESTERPRLLVVSARSRRALDRLTEALAGRLETDTNLALDDVAFTLQRGRRGFEHRRLVIVSADSPGSSPRVLAENAAQGLRRAAAHKTTDTPPQVWLDWGLDPLATFDEDHWRALGHALPGLAKEVAEGLATLPPDTPGLEVDPRPNHFLRVLAVTRALLDLGVRPVGALGAGVAELALLCAAGRLGREQALRWLTTRTPDPELRLARGRFPVFCASLATWIDDATEAAFDLARLGGRPEPLPVLTEALAEPPATDGESPWGIDLAPTRRSPGAPRLEASTWLSGDTPENDPDVGSEHDPGTTFLRLLGTLWATGVVRHWTDALHPASARRVALPTYPWDHRLHWFEERPDPDTWLHAPRWRPQPLDSLDPKHAAPGPALVLARPGGALEARWLALGQDDGEPTVWVEPGDGFEGVGPGRFRLNPQRPEDWAALWRQLPSLPSRVLHCWSAEPAASSTVEDVDRVTAHGRALALCAQSLARHGAPTDGLDLLLITRGLERFAPGDEALDETVRPALALLLGPARVLPLEMPWLRCAVIDAGAALDQPSDTVARALAQEPVAELPGPVVAWRAGERWQLAIEPVKIEPVKIEPVKIEPAESEHPLPALPRRGEGPPPVYLVTGGLGGLGATLAHALAWATGGHLVLLGRSPLPDRRLRDTEKPTDPRHLDRLRALRRIEAVAASVRYLAVDVADGDALAAALEEGLADLGPLRGVVHAAGVAGGGLVRASDDLAPRHEVLDPKTRGTLALAAALADRPLDFFVACSSLAATTGAAGQLDYCAANAFLDSWAEHAAPPAWRRVVSLAWDAWSEVGMAAHYLAANERAIRPDDGAQIFLRSLGLAERRLLVPCGPLDERRRRVRDFDLARLALDPRADVGSPGTAVLAPDAPPAEPRRQAPRHPRPELDQAFVAPGDPRQEAVAEIFADALGLDRVGIHDDFFELGGDSLIGAQIADRVRRLDGGASLGLDRVFDHPTVAALARQLAESTTDGESEERAREQTPGEGRDGPPVRHPLLPSQERLWILDRLQEDRGAYNIAGTVELVGPLDPGLLERQLRHLAASHAALRTRFGEEDGHPFQVFVADPGVRLHTVDLTALGSEAGPAVAQNLVEEAATRPFDLEHEPLLRGLLLRRGPEHFQLVLALHHMVADAWSIGLLIDDLRRLQELPEERWPTVDDPAAYGRFVRRRHGFEADATGIEFWRRSLDGVQPFRVPSDVIDPRTSDRRAAVARRPLPRHLAEGLDAWSRRRGATPFMALLTLFALLLRRLTGVDDLCLGCPVADRDQPEARGLVGFLINTLVLRLDLEPHGSLRSLLAAVRRVVLDANTHRQVPFEHLLQELDLDRDLSRPPLFDVLINQFTLPSAEDTWGDLRLAGSEILELEAKFPLALHIVREGDSSELRLVYRRALYRATRMESWLDQLLHLLAQAIADDERPLLDYDLTPERYRAGLPDPGRAPSSVVYPTVVARFLARVAEGPQRPAVVLGDRSWTYGELAESSRRLAGELIAQGLEPGQTVALRGQRGFGLMTAVLAVARAGGVLLVLDLSLPPERQRLLLERAGWPMLLALGPQEPLATEGSAPVLEIDPGDGRLLGARDTVGTIPDPLPSLGEDADAYWVFTSGSTGVPKGIRGRHQALAHTVGWQVAHFEIGPGDRVAQLATLSFDTFFRESFVALTSGASLVFLEGELNLAPDRLLPWLRDTAITVVNTVPSVVRAWLAWWPEGVTVRALRHIFFCGEALPGEVVRGWAQRNPDSATRLINLYGTSETNLAKFWHEPARDRPRELEALIPVGRPLPEVEGWVLGDDDRPCGLGEKGEIVLRSRFLGRGYLDPTLDAGRFGDNPWRDDPSDRLYRTGDIGRYREDGVLEWLGRRDHQVKIRGVRIEPEEVAAVISRHPEVEGCAVVDLHHDDGAVELVAFVVAPPGRAQPDSLRRFLQQRLPSAMFPSRTLRIDRLPLNANAKTDLGALRRQLQDASMQDAAAPLPATANPPTNAPAEGLERQLATLWSAVLEVPRVTAEDDFFDLGGQSLKAMVLVSRIRRDLGVDFPLREAFETRTVREQAARIAELRQSADPRPTDDGPPLAPRPHDGDQPLAPSQERLWFLQRLAPDSAAYNLNAGLEIEGPLDLDRLGDALTRIVARHESLRTRFVGRAEGPVQRVEPSTSFDLPVVDLAMLPDAEALAEGTRRLEAMARRPFDLARDTLLRVEIYRLGNDHHLLGCSLHHIVSDRWSVEVLLRELAVLYAPGGETAALPALPVQFLDYVLWHRQRVDSPVFEACRDYWRDQLRDAPTRTGLPPDHRRPKGLTFVGDARRATLPEAVVSALATQAEERGGTLFMALLTVFEVLVARAQEHGDVVVGCPFSGRTRPEIEPLIGFFVHALPLRTRLLPGMGFDAALAQVRETVLGAQQHQDVAMSHLFRDLRSQRDLAANPHFQVMFVFQNQGLPDLGFADARVRLLPVENRSSKFDLTFEVEPRADGGLDLRAEFNTDLYETTTVETFLADFLALASRVAEHPETPLAELAELPLETAPVALDPGVEVPRVAPRHALEATLHGLWCEVLEREDFGVLDNFFDLGGHSLVAMRLSTRIDETFGIEIGLQRFFTALTVADMARVVEEAMLETLDEAEFETLRQTLEAVTDPIPTRQPVEA